MNRTTKYVSEPHIIVVRVWHNARWHDVADNHTTAPILQGLHHTDPREYYNPTPREWDILHKYKIGK